MVIPSHSLLIFDTFFGIFQGLK